MTHIPNLIFLEGLPGSGKSTNARMLRANLERMGRKVKWVHEVARPHPTLFFDEVSLTYAEYENFLKSYPEALPILEKTKIQREQMIAFDLLELKWHYHEELGQSALKALEEFNVWLFSIEKYILVALDKWKAFMNEVKQHSDHIYLMDSSLFQFQIYTFLEKNLPIQDLENFIEHLFGLIKELNPSLIFLYREDPEDSIKFLEEKRGLQFFQRIWERDQHQPYYADKPEGAEGYRHFLRDYSRYVSHLYDMTPFRKQKIDLANRNWDDIVTEMLTFLNVDRQEVKTFPANNFVGLYKNKQLDFQIDVHENFIIDPSGSEKSIFSRKENEFYLEDLPVILVFEKDRLIVQEGQLIDRWTETGTVYRKVIKEESHHARLRKKFI